MLINKKNGFSLIELLVTISIIAVLSAVLVANFMGARERARDAQKIQDLNAVKNALRMYYNDNQSYPGTVDNSSYNLSSDIGTSYMSNISNVSYTYLRTNGGDGFILTTGLEAGAGTDDTDSQVKCGIGPTADKIFAVCAN
jgi:prepilin-type N-terminal cleavage/methylation domain-containing protein